MSSNNSKSPETQDTSLLRRGYDKHTLPFEEITLVLNTADFVQGLLIDGSLAVVYGQPGSGKTFFATTLALHVAAELPFAGRRVEQGGVLYCALEGSIGFHNRIVAWRDAHGLDDARIPFVATTIPINLLDPDANLPGLVELVRRCARLMGAPTRLVVIDTLARAIAGGNENAPEDMGALVANADTLRRSTSACVLLVHHTGKDASRGARGHSSLAAAVDTEIEIAIEDRNHCATVSKQRDLDSGAIIPFTLDRVVLGANRHGEDVTSCLINFPVQIKARQTPLSGHQRRAFDVLADLIARTGQTGFPGCPNYLASVPEDWWRQNFYQRALPGEKPDTKQRAFRRAASQLIDIGRVAMNANRVWIPQPSI